MIDWIKKLFNKRERYNIRTKTLYDYFIHVHSCIYEHRSMSGYIREHVNCNDYNRMPSKKILKRYNLEMSRINILSWYLLEQYFQGNIEIKTKEDVQPE